MSTLRDVIDGRADAEPDAMFLFAPEPGTTLTYGGLRATAVALCSDLVAHGVAPGEVVSYMLPNGVSAASVFLGAMYGGYVVSPVSLLAQDALLEIAQSLGGKQSPLYPACRRPSISTVTRSTAWGHRVKQAWP